MSAIRRSSPNGNRKQLADDHHPTEPAQGRSFDLEQLDSRLKVLTARNEQVARQCTRAARLKNELAGDLALDALALTDNIQGMLVNTNAQIDRLRRDSKRLSCPSLNGHFDQQAFERRMVNVNSRYINNCLDIACFAVEKAESLLDQCRAAQSQSRQQR